MTLEQAVRQGEAQLSTGPHPDRARRDAETLLLHVIRRNRAAMLARWNEVLIDTEVRAVKQLIERRLAGEPIQYIVGDAEFYGLPFRVTPDVLIPRPETEHLVEKTLELAAGFPVPRIVDIGSGSGAIAVALAHHLPQAEITSIDLSAPALAIAKENAERNRVSRIRFLQGDLLAPVQTERFEMVVSNPPYVPATDRPTLSVEVREFEPSLALFAGNDGLSIYRRLIPAAHAALVPGGFLLLEIGHGQQQSIEELLTASNFTSVQFIPDLQNIPRIACAEKAR
jgi:release factor glutamine methyltransferase